MTLTLRDVREGLGFQPVKIFRVEQREKMKKLAADPSYSKAQAKGPRGRQTGQTTEMLLRAVHAASRGNKVFITGRNSSTFRDMARLWCRKLGVDPAMVVSRVPEYDYPTCKVFSDHTCSC